MTATQQNTVSASGAMYLSEPSTIALACSSTISTSISTAAWNLPGTPAVARDAAMRNSSRTIAAHSSEKNSVSQCTTLRSKIECCSLLDR